MTPKAPVPVRLNKGDVFTFAGRTLKFVRVRDMTAWVRRVHETTSVVPHWTGARLALSPELAGAVHADYLFNRVHLNATIDGDIDGIIAASLQVELANEAVELARRIDEPLVFFATGFETTAVATAAATAISSSSRSIRRRAGCSSAPRSTTRAATTPSSPSTTTARRSRGRRSRRSTRCSRRTAWMPGR